MWIRTGKNHINTDKIEHTEILPTGSIRLIFSNGQFVTLKDNEATEVTFFLDSISTPSWTLIPKKELEDDNPQNNP